MENADDNYVKILFRFKNKLLEGLDVETMWATVVDKEKGLYKLDNIPFYAPLIASDDVVFAEYDESELMLTYRKTVENSGNSIVRVVIMDEKMGINEIREIFKNMGCESERTSDILFSMEILYNLDYKPIKQKLKELEHQGIIGYSEPCLSNKHSQL